MTEQRLREALELGRDAAEEVLNATINRYTSPDGSLRDFRGRVTAAREALAKIEAALAAPIAAPADEALPPLPSPYVLTRHDCEGADGEDLFTADDMHAYARAAMARPPADEARDAARFQYLQNIDAKIAQAFFWNNSGRKERAKAIDAAIAATPAGSKP